MPRHNLKVTAPRAPQSSKRLLKLVPRLPESAPEEALPGQLIARIDVLDELLASTLQIHRTRLRLRPHYPSPTTLRHLPLVERVYVAIAVGARTWRQIRLAALVRSDEELNDALNILIPTRIKTRDDGSGRVFFLPGRIKRYRAQQHK